MRLDYDAPQTRDAGRFFSDAAERSDRAFNDALARARQSVTPSDVLDELADYEEALSLAGDAEAIGRIYLAARDALVMRLAIREVTL